MSYTARPYSQDEKNSARNNGHKRDSQGVFQQSAK
jgi:hypothetical protein